MNDVEIKEYPNLNEVMYKKVLDNGLTVFINKKKGYKKIFSSFITNFGAGDTTFIPIGESEYITVPLGVAHFLEHKMFDMPDGIDATNLFSDLGADANAYTDYNETAYIVSCTSNFEKVLEILLDFVQTPYFTDKSVEKEKGIIIEELKMYQDNPTDRIYNLLMRNMYKINNHREDVVGTIDSINSITKEILYTCYYTFYNPSNMYLCISGDVDVDKTLKLIEDNQNKKKFLYTKDIKRKYYLESSFVYKKRGKDKMDISMPRVCVGIKLPAFPFIEDLILKFEIITKMMLEYSFGFSSTNYQTMLDKDLVSGFTNTLSYDKSTAQIKFIANSNNPKGFVKFMKKELLKFKDYHIDDDSLTNLKKGLIGSTIRSYESEEFVSTAYVEYLMKNCDIFHTIDIINSITLKDLKDFGSNFKEDSFSSFILYPKYKNQ